MSFFNETFSFDSILTDVAQPLSDALSPQKDPVQAVVGTLDGIDQLAQGLENVNLAGAVNLLDDIADAQSLFPGMQGLDDVLMSDVLGRYLDTRDAGHLPSTPLPSLPTGVDTLTGQGRALTEVVDGDFGDVDDLSNDTVDDAIDTVDDAVEVPWDEREPLNPGEIVPVQTDAAGNTLAAARNIGVLSTNQTFSDFVGASDSNDYYRFSLAQGSNFNLALTGLSADADVQVLNSAGKIIHGSYKAGASSETFTQALGAGDYYIRVYPFQASGNTNYQLAVSASAISIPDGAGNTLGTARDIGSLSNTQTFSDFVGTSDTNDYYRFSLSQSSRFNLELNGLTADADVQLLNSSGQVIDLSLGPGSSTESINRDLAAGTYYVRVYPFDIANTNYRLTLTATERTATPAFNSVYGYGIVDAAAAVARAAGQTASFPSVASLGGNSWGLDMVNAPAAWNQGYTGDNVVVAVIDSGVDINHVDLRDNIWVNANEIPNNGIDDDGNGYIDDINGWNFGVGQNNNNVLPGTNDPGQGHGTHVAGTIAAANNGVGMTGVAHEAQIMALRLGDVVGGRFINPGSLAEAIRYAVDNGADVINMSLGAPDSPELRSALAYAASNNVITVSAAGNGDRSGNGLPSPGNPARYATQYGISVGAVDINQDIARFSNRAGSDSALQHVTAPGVNVYSTRPNDTYNFSSGTSMATPHVAGVIALMLEANPNLTHAQVRQILTESAVQVSQGDVQDVLPVT